MPDTKSCAGTLAWMLSINVTVANSFSGSQVHVSRLSAVGDGIIRPGFIAYRWEWGLEFLVTLHQLLTNDAHLHGQVLCELLGI